MPRLYYDQNGLVQHNQINIASTQQETNDHHELKKLHKGFAIFLIASIFLTYRFIFQNDMRKNCTFDQIHELTFNLNRWINSNSLDLFIGLGQIIMDVCVCSSTLYWILFLKNFRYPVVMCLFQYSRSIMLKIITMPYAAYVLWQNPGFPSLSVPYQHTSDYFFSGHTGTLIIIYLECRKVDLPIWIKGYLVFSLVYIISMLLIGRVHYTIDVVAGFVYASYFYGLVEKNLSFFDHIMNCPYQLAHAVKEQVKQKFLQNDDQGTSLYDIQHN